MLKPHCLTQGGLVPPVLGIREDLGFLEKEDATLQVTFSSSKMERGATIIIGQPEIELLQVSSFKSQEVTTGSSQENLDQKVRGGGELLQGWVNLAQNLANAIKLVESIPKEDILQ